MRVEIVREAAKAFGKAAARMATSLEPDAFVNPELYPPREASKREVTAYFLVMVAMDHRASRPGRPYEGYVEGKLYHGSELLYRLGSKKLSEDPGFFDATRLARLELRELEEWLTNGERIRRPPDLGLRLELLRDIGQKLLRLYEGDPFALVLESRGRLREGAGGFVNLLKAFKAYQDPVEKKAFLLAKFLERRRVLHIADQHNKEVPVDNHLVRIALRIGLVRVDEESLEKIAAGVELGSEEDVMLRLAVRIAYKEAAAAGAVDPFLLDDILWAFGRHCCTRERPTCRGSCSEGCRAVAGCNGGCSLAPVCSAFREPKLMVPEHRFYSHWY
ncbi:MAG: hypothetical protein N3F67_00120 [Acidilobaceae archaeon]|nr:hypothetical protein [Acidilobaceae archaeon]